MAEKVLPPQPQYLGRLLKICGTAVFHSSSDVVWTDVSMSPTHWTVNSDPGAILFAILA